jgi:hypothetical protein
VFHGNRGELRQRYREGQEDQLGALGLVVNIIALWNTLYMEAALAQLRKEGYPVRNEDVARLSPLIYDHINLLGRYSFTVPESVSRGERPQIECLPILWHHDSRRPESSWERRNKKHSTITGVQKVPGALSRRLITRRIALSTQPLPQGTASSRNRAYCRRWWLRAK